MNGAANDATDPVLTIRKRRGMTQEVLAGLVGKSVSWLKDVESGRLQQNPRPPIPLYEG
ncbi:helix-turn-helix domain-containing protein [Streptosporangium sp. V21-05]|uniref:helix-turn-helix domain-containing protein n=1 Tax=Streptosporangium sp. V21-05 TaxID=3446115 RepID=UPI003F52E8C5